MTFNKKSYASRRRWLFLSKDPRLRLQAFDLEEADGDFDEARLGCTAEPQSVLTRCGVVQAGISEFSLQGEW